MYLTKVISSIYKEFKQTYEKKLRTPLKSGQRPGTVAQACNPSTLGGQGGWIMRSRNQDHPGQHGATPSLPKIQKLAGLGGACL